VNVETGGARLRLDLAYDGTDFSGWAIQPGLRTVQGELESAIGFLLREDGLRLTVGGRTDAGVHARGQVAHLDVTEAQLSRWNARRQPQGALGEEQERERDQAQAPDQAPDQDPGRLRARKLNGVLKRSASDIAIHSVRVVPVDFDARFSALRRRYEYRLRDERAKRDPLTTRFTADVPRTLDIDAMQWASDELLGLNDFTSFCKAREGATAVRDLLTFEWRVTSDGAYTARLEADAFCHSMVRALVGAVVAVGSGRIARDELRQLRDARERTSRFTVMPARGLSLEEISYPAEEDLAARAALTRARRDAARDPVL
jgi:tRNA pseudouridine38-40 synthase